ncbi:MAG: hypothetical protein EOO75_01090 [Myxococcales bacterium]|nr:MAG: hypothetical protein EOO75_01090 [Myxococcales bacterium]
MEAVSAGVYDALPAQVRDRLPAEVMASAQNAQVFRATFDVLPRLVDDLLARLRQVEGQPWPMWKLVAAFYLVEVQIGHNSVTQAGERIYSTMPWPPTVKTIADALRFTQTAYLESHLRTPVSAIGGWKVESEGPDRMVLVDETPYPCHFSEGVVAGICRKFSRQRPNYRRLAPHTSRRAGGTSTRYEITYIPA